MDLCTSFTKLLSTSVRNSCSTSPGNAKSPSSHLAMPLGRTRVWTTFVKTNSACWKYWNCTMSGSSCRLRRSLKITKIFRWVKILRRSLLSQNGSTNQLLAYQSNVPIEEEKYDSIEFFLNIEYHRNITYLMIIAIDNYHKCIFVDKFYLIVLTTSQDLFSKITHIGRKLWEVIKYKLYLNYCVNLAEYLLKAL